MGDHQLQLFVRSLRPLPGTHTQRARLLEKLRIAHETNRIDGYDTHVLGDEICLCRRCREGFDGNPLWETALELATWRDGTVTSTSFLERAVHSELTDEQYRIVVPPEITVGVYLDGTLSGVFPCVDEDTRYEVAGFLTSLVDDLQQPETAGNSRRIRRRSP